MSKRLFNFYEKNKISTSPSAFHKKEEIYELEQNEMREISIEIEDLIRGKNNTNEFRKKETRNSGDIPRRTPHFR